MYGLFSQGGLPITAYSLLKNIHFLYFLFSPADNLLIFRGSAAIRSY